MDDTVNIIKIRQTFQNCYRHNGNDVDVDSTYLLVYPVQRPFVHEFHADADVGIR